MVTGSANSKLWHAVIRCVLCISILLLLSGCDPYFNSEPFWKGNYTWTSNDPQIVLRFEVIETQHGDTVKIEYSENSYIILDGQVIPIETADRSSIYWVYHAGYIGSNSKLLFWGSWEYQDKGQKLVFSITEDSVFDSQYEKIVFTRQETQ